jgi:hypothetical protein
MLNHISERGFGWGKERILLSKWSRAPHWVLHLNMYYIRHRTSSSRQVKKRFEVISPVGMWFSCWP